MSLRRRVTLAGALAAAAAVALACAATYLAVRSELLRQVDEQLHQQGQALQRLIATDPPEEDVLRKALPQQLTPSQGGPLPYFQALDASGRALDRPDGTPAPGPAVRIPIDAEDRRIAAAGGGDILREVRIDGVRTRLLTAAVPDGGGAVQVARPLDSVDRVLSRLRWILSTIALGGVALAALLGRLVTRRVTAPLREVAEAAEEIARTEDLTRRIGDPRSDDEVGQLARRFDTMLDRLEASRAALAGSVAAQRQLVADASHELRTPITSLRTNIEVLLEGGELGPADRERLLADLRDQTEELGALVADVIELARGDVAPPVEEDVRLDVVAADVVDRARRHHPGLAFSLTTVPVILDGAPDRLGRAITNLLSNAAKHAPAGSTVEVTVDPTGVRVRDHGPGVAEADLPHLFDRFYRGASARGLPGTGLGLAIVRQVAESHGGAALAANAPDGGAVFTLALRGRVLEGVAGEAEPPAAVAPSRPPL